MKKTVTYLLAVLLSGTAMGVVNTLEAQESQVSITQGERGKYILFDGAPGIKIANISADNRYVGGAAHEQDYGFIYDIEKDTFMISNSVEFMVSPDFYVGNGKICKKGKLTTLETPYTGISSEFNKVSIWATTPDVEKIFGMAYEEIFDFTIGKARAFNFMYIYDKNGKIVEKIEPKWPLNTDPAGEDNAGYGERVNGVNNDGTILAGHSAKPGIGTNWSPVFWDLNNDTSYGLINTQYSHGSLGGTNNDGSIIYGRAFGASQIIRYDKENKSYTMEAVPFSIGKGNGMLTSLSENGLALFYQQASGVDLGSREAYIYDINNKEMTLLNEYIDELYGIKVSAPIFSASKISDDGRLISGFTYGRGEWYPYAIVLDENQVLAKARTLMAEQKKGEMKVSLKWRAPLRSQYTLQGFNVYCDSVQINKSLLSAEELQYEHVEGLAAGIHKYNVEAIYTEGKSAFCKPAKIYVVDDNGCFPVQEIGNNIAYNRTVEVYWNLPSSRMVSDLKSSPAQDRSTCPVVKGVSAEGLELINAKSYNNEKIDLIDIHPSELMTISSGVLIGDKVYVSDYQFGGIRVFEASDFSLVSVHFIEGLKSIYNMVHVGGQLYCAGKEGEISIVDIATMTISNRLKTTAGETVHHIAYIPTLDKGKGGFAYGDWTHIHYCDMYGRTLSTNNQIDVSNLSVMGSAYYNGKYYAYSQTGRNRAEIYTFDFEKGSLLNKVDLSEEHRLDAISENGFVAGGMSLCILPDSTIALGAMLQFNTTFNHFVYLEIAGSPNLLGYNLYKNDVKINPDGEYIKGLSYDDVIMEPGEYVYTVEVVNKDNCKSKLEEANTTATILPIGQCASPSKVKAVESNSSAMLTWELDNTEGDVLVGFNVYRNKELVQEHLFDLKYTDENISVGDYAYTIEAFYDNSCVAEDSTKISITREGVKSAPTGFSLEIKQIDEDKFDVAAKWELPYFENPLAFGYCNMPYRGVALEECAPIYAVIGWDSAMLEPYRDLYVVGVEYFIGESIERVDGLVYINDTLVYKKEANKRISENNWNTIMFDEYISMDQPMEVVVGYKVAYKDKTKYVAVFDFGPAAPYGDFISGDGQQWGNLGYNANWCINALVVKKRDMEQLKKRGGKIEKGTPIVKVMSHKTVKLTEPQDIAQTATSAKTTGNGIRLLGFNLYKNEAKVNSEIIKEKSFTDKSVEKGVYEYSVAAVYDGESQEEILSSVFEIDLSGASLEDNFKLPVIVVYPNPATEQIVVKGEYKSLEILNISGSLVKSVDGGKSAVDISNIPSGAYMLRFTLPDGKVYVRKLVVK